MSKEILDCIMCGYPASLNDVYCLGCSQCVICSERVKDNAWYCEDHYWGKPDAR